MQLDLTYATTYRYDPRAGHALTALRIRPRSRPGLLVERSLLRVTGGTLTASYVDGFGAVVDFVECQQPVDEVRFETQAHAVVEPAERLADATEAELSWFLRDSPRVRTSAVAPLRETLELDGSRWESVEILVSLLRNWMMYRIGITDAETPIEYVVETREGVCQDFAHVLIGVLRAWGWPARYASGYMYDGGPEGSIEADAMHAWVEVFRRGVGWIGVDPTTGGYTTDGYVLVGLGRDYDDVRPIRGVVTGPTSQSQRSHLTIVRGPDQ